LLAVLILLNLPLSVSSRIKAGLRDGLVPFQNTVSLLVCKGRETLSFALNARKAVSERQKMLGEITGFRREVRRLEALKEDNRDLRKLLGFKSRQERKLILCEATARGDVSGWWQTIRLNKGSYDGIGRNMAVITTDGLIGKTIEVSRHTCDVLLITDPNCKVASELSRTEAFGIVRGKGVALNGDMKLEMLCAAHPCRMDYIPKDQEARQGDEVITSGLGGVYPRGLLVGYVQKSEVDPSGLYQCADIVPAAKMAVLRYAFIVVR